MVLCWKWMPNTHNLQHLSGNLYGSVLKVDAWYSWFTTPSVHFTRLRAKSVRPILIICSTSRSIYMVLCCSWMTSTHTLQRLLVSLHGLMICNFPRLICVVLCWVWMPKTHNLQYITVNFHGSDTALYWKRMPNTNNLPPPSRSVYMVLCWSCMPSTQNLQHLSISLHGSVWKLDALYS